MTDYVRVKQADTGHELSIPRDHFEHAPDGAYDEVDKPAVDEGGDPLPPKYKTSVRAAAAKKTTSGQSAEKSKES